MLLSSLLRYTGESMKKLALIFHVCILAFNTQKVHSMDHPNSSKNNQIESYEELYRLLKKYKKRILGIMHSTLDKPIDFNPTGSLDLGRLNNTTQEYSYSIKNKERKTMVYSDLERMLDSDDQEFNIADIYDGKISDETNEKNPLTKKPQKKCSSCLLN